MWYMSAFRHMKYWQFVILAFGVFSIIWLLSGIHPNDPANWLMESKIFFSTLPLTIALVLYVRLSKFSLFLIIIFLLLHVVGMHYNYGQVPFGYWLGHMIHTDRNMYDRLVHAMFGLLLVYPIREMLLRFDSMKGFFGYFIPINMILSMSALYEIMEWYSSLKINSHEVYLFIGGTDPFDAEKDMLMALIGSIVAIGIVFWINSRKDDHFLKRLGKSLELKDNAIKEDFIATHVE
jgi:putative membrane protein